MSQFTVDQNGLETSAKQLDQAAADLEAVQRKLQNPPGYSADNYGEYGADEAAKNFISAWQDEMQVNVDALHELAGKIRATAANYQAADHAVRDVYRGHAAA